MADSSVEVVAQQPPENQDAQNQNKTEAEEELTDTIQSNPPEKTTVLQDGNTDNKGTESHVEEQAAADDGKQNETEGAANEPASEEKEDNKGEGLPQEKADAAKAQRTPPAEKKKEEISDAQRKAKIEEMRKRKITDYKKKEDEKRKAVLERKKKLEEAERQKQEALLKKISATAVTPKRPASAPARRAVSFSSLHHLKKTHAVAQEIDIDGGKPPKAKEAEDKVSKQAPATDRRRTLPSRPASAMERKRPSSLYADKEKPALVKNGSEATAKPAARPRSSVGTRVEPKIRQSISNLPNRPSSAAANRPTQKADETKAKTGTTKPRPSMPSLPGKPLVPPNKEKELKKAKSHSSILHQSSQEKPKGPVQPGKKTPESNDKTKPKAAPAKPSSAKPRPDLAKAPRPSTGKAKEPTRPSATADKKERRPSKEGSPAGKPSAKPDASKKAGIMDEAEAKRIMAEKRRQVKEEQERKKLVEENRLEEERIRKEEERKRRAEELQKEQERQQAHLEELRKEAEERERREKEEKLRKEMEEKERLEAEKRQRQDDIDRRAQEEVDKRAKEREQKRQQEEAERMERKKRVQEILESRVRSSPVAERPVSPTPFAMGNSDEAASENSPPAIDSAVSARDRVQKLLEKNQRKSEDSLNGSENGDTPKIIKPELSPGRSGAENRNEDLSQGDRLPDAAKTNGQSTVGEGTLESSLTEVDKQTVEDEKRKNDNNLDHSINNGADNLKQDSMEENQNLDAKDEEKKLWNEAEEVMGENEDNLSNSFEKQTKIEQSQNNQENALWHLVEGQLELEECF